MRNTPCTTPTLQVYWSWRTPASSCTPGLALGDKMDFCLLSVPVYLSTPVKPVPFYHCKDRALKPLRGHVKHLVHSFPYKKRGKILKFIPECVLIFLPPYPCRSGVWHALKQWTVLSGQLCFAKNSHLLAYTDIKETLMYRKPGLFWTLMF